jgi:hypothetical protein
MSLRAEICAAFCSEATSSLAKICDEVASSASANPDASPRNDMIINGGLGLCVSDCSGYRPVDKA